ncbi:MAG: selenocysteine-specific translation elongation factor [Candidatus Delongbacteria bacterium]|jgi:selenocysteine-specific elongation factor|nr:selenocysteine-specific translation elongation factor [Candidatus Delongbacteria bacterium]
MSHFIIGTAGHIDHGKTSLVKALTGMDTDVLKEEKERNITIDIGFAFLGDDITIIDVPGHEKFIKNMVAGVSTIDFVLFVIAADDGVMPQTREHLDILNLLQIKDGMVVVTKSGMVEEEWLELVTEEIKEYLQGTFLEGAPVVAVDSLSRKGIDTVLEIINEKKLSKVERVDKGIFKLPIDRVFTMKGFGTIITGTILSGDVKEGETLSLQPKGMNVRVKGLQCHGQKQSALTSGDRAAINLHGVSVDDIARGDILVSTGYLEPTYIFDGKLYLLSTAKELKNRARVRIHAGTNEIFGRVVLLDKEKLEPGTEALVEIRLEEEMNLSPGERFVIRSYSPQMTIGGGQILTTVKKKSKRFDKEKLSLLKELEKGDPQELVEEILLSSKYEPFVPSEISKKLAKTDDETLKMLDNLISQDKILVIGKGNKKMYFHNRNIDTTISKINTALDEFHKKNPYRQGISKEDLRTKISQAFNQVVFDYILKKAESDELIQVSQNVITKKGFEIQLNDEMQKKLDTFLEVLDENRFKPPVIKTIADQIPMLERDARELAGMLMFMGKVIKLDEGLLISKATLEEAKKLVSDKIKTSGHMKLGEISELLDSSRKYVVPLMEYLDKIGFTVRDGDFRKLKD